MSLLVPPMITRTQSFESRSDFVRTQFLRYNTAVWGNDGGKLLWRVVAQVPLCTLRGDGTVGRLR